MPKVPAKRGPNLGEHNDEILKELGFEGNAIVDLRNSGALGKAATQPAEAAKKPLVPVNA